jgi:glycogen synthase
VHIVYVAIDYGSRGEGGGIASYVTTVTSGLIERGHRVTVLAKGDTRGDTREGKLRVLRAPLGNLHWYAHRLHAPSIAVQPLRELEWSRDLRLLFERSAVEDPVDLVEAHETGAVFLTRAFGRSLPPLVIRLHGDQHVFARHAGEPLTIGGRIDHAMQRWVWQRAHALSSPSMTHAHEIRREMGWPEDRIHVIPNGLTPELFCDALTLPRHTGARQKGLVLYTGRIEVRKGSISLLEAIPLVVARESRVRFAIAGGRHPSVSDGTFARLTRKPLTAHHLDLLGHVSPSALPGLYRRAEIFVMPSYYETFGISVVEAMAFGLPVVAAGGGALPEIVEDGVTGIVVPPGSSTDLADAILTLLHDPRLRHRLGENGRERAMTLYHPRRVVLQTEDFYSRTLTVSGVWRT